MSTILVVDDDAYMRELLHLHLSNAGYDLLVAEDAVVAGHSLLRQLKADPAVCDIPVVFVSSRDDCEDKAKELGAGAFLQKPVLADHLLATVAGYVEGGRFAL